MQSLRTACMALDDDVTFSAVWSNLFMHASWQLCAKRQT